MLKYSQGNTAEPLLRDFLSFKTTFFPSHFDADKLLPEGHFCMVLKVWGAHWKKVVPLCQEKHLKSFIRLK